jgi:DNA gyrase subunit A
MSVRFDESNVRVMGRAARGVKGITLSEGDYVTGVTVVEDDKWLLTVTENGYGKLSPFSDFREMKNRGGRGVTCQNTDGKYGALAGIATVSDDDDIMLITNLGQLIRIPADSIRKCSRAAGGVIIMRLADDQNIVNFTRISNEETDSADSDNAEPEITVTERSDKPDMPMLSDEADVEPDPAG